MKTETKMKTELKTGDRARLTMKPGDVIDVRVIRVSPKTVTVEYILPPDREALGCIPCSWRVTKGHPGLVKV